MGREQAYQKFVGTSAPPKPTSMPVLPPKTESVNATPTATEPTTPSQEATTPKTELDSSRIALLAKKEAALQKEREAFKKEREEWLTKEKAEADKVLARAKEFNELSEKDKIAALKMIGWSETDIFNAMAGAEKTEPTAEEIAAQVADKKLQEYKEEQAKLAAEAEKSNNEKLISNLKSDIASGIKSQADKFEFCAFEGKAAEAQAYEFMVEILKESGDLISVDEALEMTEALYEERAKALQKLKKLQPKVEEQPVPPSQQGRSRAPISNVPQPNTKKVATIPPAPTDRRESRSEKRERLIQAIMTGGLAR